MKKIGRVLCLFCVALLFVCICPADAAETSVRVISANKWDIFSVEAGSSVTISFTPSEDGNYFLADQSGEYKLALLLSGALGKARVGRADVCHEDGTTGNAIGFSLKGGTTYTFELKNMKNVEKPVKIMMKKAPLAEKIKNDGEYRLNEFGTNIQISFEPEFSPKGSYSRIKKIESSDEQMLTTEVLHNDKGQIVAHVFKPGTAVITVTFENNITAKYTVCCLRPQNLHEGNHQIEFQSPKGDFLNLHYKGQQKYLVCIPDKIWESYLYSGASDCEVRHHYSQGYLCMEIGGRTPEAEGNMVLQINLLPGASRTQNIPVLKVQPPQSLKIYPVKDRYGEWALTLKTQPICMIGDVTWSRQGDNISYEIDRDLLRLTGSKSGFALFTATDKSGLSDSILMPYCKEDGWHQTNGKWVYVQNGDLIRGDWMWDGRFWSVFDEMGYMLTGWQKFDGYWYLIDTHGHMQKGWQWVDGVWYLFDNSGHMQTGWQWIDGIWYLFDNSGHMQTGWQWIDGIWYLFDNSGHMQTGWQWRDGIWYLFDNSGHMQTGWQWRDGIWYLFNRSGHMQTGWQQVDGVWYYFNPSGHLTQTA